MPRNHRFRTRLALFALVLVLCPWFLRAQEPPTVRTPPPEQMEAPNNTQQPAAPDEVERYTLSHDRYEKAVAYSRAGYTLYFCSVFVGLLVLFIALRTGFVGRLRDFAQRKSENRLLQGLIFVPLLAVLLDFADLPVHIVWHALSLHYQQSVQRWGSWLMDWTKAELIDVAFLALMGILLFFVMRWSPRRWWFYFWLLALPIVLSMLLLKPLIIDPLFFKFEPLAAHQAQFADEIARLTQRAGLSVPRERMFLVIASDKTNQVNAYVTGVGASQRVVIYDTLIQKMKPQEALFVFGHESGHYVLNHIRNGFLFFAACLLIGLYLAYRLLNLAVDRWGLRWKVYGPQDWAALALLLLILEGMAFLSSPVVNGYSRWEEHCADIFGLELIYGIVPNSAQVAAHSFQALGEIDLADPNPPPFITFWLYTHPPLADRLIFAHSYDPWSRNQPPKYIRDKK